MSSMAKEQEHYNADGDNAEGYSDTGTDGDTVVLIRF